MAYRWAADPADSAVERADSVADPADSGAAQADQAGDQADSAADQVVDQVVDQVGDQVVDLAVDRVVDRAADRFEPHPADQRCETRPEGRHTRPGCDSRQRRTFPFAVAAEVALERGARDRRMSHRDLSPSYKWT